MKIKPLWILAIILLPILSYAQEEKFEHHCFFEHKSLTVGVAAPYSVDLNTVGLNLRMYHNINEHICFGPEFSIFKRGEVEIVDFDFVMYNIN